MGYITKGQQAERDLVQRRIDAYCPDLVECQFTIGVLLVHPSPSNPDRPALIRNGYPVTGDVKKSNYEDRVQGKPDATLKLDAANWACLTEEEQEAEIDHWLHCIQIIRDKKTKAIKVDDCGRPLFKKRPHDVEVGIYDEIIRRHGRSAPEAKLIEDLSIHYGTLLPRTSPDAVPDGEVKPALI